MKKPTNPERESHIHEEASTPTGKGFPYTKNENTDRKQNAIRRRRGLSASEPNILAALSNINAVNVHTMATKSEAVSPDIYTPQKLFLLAIIRRMITISKVFKLKFIK